jgi:hypothetical protein
LTVEARNYLSANELGVLLAQYGQLADARRLFQHSVAVKPHVEGWHNLAAVHRRLGEQELAKLAEGERTRLAQAEAARTDKPTDDLIRWVDPQTFARSAGPDDRGPTTAGKPTPTGRR